MRDASRQPPYAPEAEVSVLGALLIDPAAMNVALEIISSSDFYREAHRRVFAAMTEVHRRGHVVDPVTVSEELTAHGSLDLIGGVQYLAELMDAVPSAANIEYHAKIVRDRAQRRGLITAASEIIQDAYDSPNLDVTELMAAAQTRVFRAAESSIPGAKKDRLQRAMYAVLESMERPPKVVPTGFTGIDRLLDGGVRPGEYMILAARPGVGKSAMVLQILLGAAQSGHKVGLWSLEMSDEQWARRALAQLGQVDGSSLRTGKGLMPNDYAAIGRAAEVILPLPIDFGSDTKTRPAEFRLEAQRMVRDGAELLVVDYLQLMAPDDEAHSRENEVARASRAIKLVTKELGVPVIAIAMLRRPGNENKRPTLGDLRESGSLEQDADIVMFLHREIEDEDENPDVLSPLTKVIVAKNRDGKTGAVWLYYRGHTLSFEDHTR